MRSQTLASLLKAIKKFRQTQSKPQVIDREYIEGETADEISYVNYSDLPDKFDRPIPHIPKSHQPRYDHKVKKKAG